MSDYLYTHRSTPTPRGSRRPHAAARASAGVLVGAALCGLGAALLWTAQGQLVHEFKPFDTHTYNVRHTIHSLSFGVHYPNRVNPLDGATAILRNGSGVFQYFVINATNETLATVTRSFNCAFIRS